MNWIRRHPLLTALAALAILCAVLVQVVLDRHSDRPASAGSPANMCYLTLSGAEVTEYVSVDMVTKDQTCASLALLIQQVLPGATVTADGSAKPYGAGYQAACLGLITPDYDPASVVAWNGDDTGGACTALGLETLP